MVRSVPEGWRGWRFESVGKHGQLVHAVHHARPLRQIYLGAYAEHKPLPFRLFLREVLRLRNGLASEREHYVKAKLLLSRTDIYLTAKNRAESPN
jgi:hypothetical protein